MISPLTYFVLYLMAFAALFTGTVLGGWMVHAPWRYRLLAVVVLAVVLRLTVSLPAPPPFLGFGDGWVDWIIFGILNGWIRFRVVRV